MCASSRSKSCASTKARKDDDLVIGGGACGSVNDGGGGDVLLVEASAWKANKDTANTLVATKLVILAASPSCRRGVGVLGKHPPNHAQAPNDQLNIADAMQ